MKKKYFLVQITYQTRTFLFSPKKFVGFRLSCAMDETTAKANAKDYFNKHWGKGTPADSKIINTKIIPTL